MAAKACWTTLWRARATSHPWRRLSLAVLALLAGHGPSAARDNERTAAITYVKTQVMAWLDEPVMIDGLRDGNAFSQHLSFDDILALDASWKAEFDAPTRPLIDPIESNALSRFLKEKQRAAGGKITELIVMNARGLNVGISEPTSDYWQGDEDKWRWTYLKGKGAMFVDTAGVDPSTGIRQRQISLTITDPRTGQPIGAIAIGIRVTEP